jgi:lipid II:glycine glycyltransferase (peptidoglycan interpeptide bridge formation enzyme)
MPEKVHSETLRPASAHSSGASVVDLAPEIGTWDAFVRRSNPGSYLQTSAWAEVKAPNGWLPVRFMGTSVAATLAATAADPAQAPAPAGATGSESEPGTDDAIETESPGDPLSLAALDRLAPVPNRETAFGVQLLVRKPRLFPWAFAYAPRGPLLDEWGAPTVEAFTSGLRQVLAAGPTRVSHVRIEPEIELDGPSDVDGELRRALRQNGWRPATPIQPARTRQIDLRADETALWGDLRKKWRQYVNKARKSEVRVVDATIERLPEFYSIYKETAKRAGFIIRTYESYVGVWQAFDRLGMARLLMAENPGGEGLATLFVLRVGDRVIEPYGGMTAAGAELRANYLLKWEAIRTSREQGAASYDMWGISHEGIEHFKSGFGGREIRYVGAWDLVLDPAGRLAFDSAQAVQDRIGRLRHGIGHVRGYGRSGGAGGAAGGSQSGSEGGASEAGE